MTKEQKLKQMIAERKKLIDQNNVLGYEILRINDKLKLLAEEKETDNIRKEIQTQNARCNQLRSELELNNIPQKIEDITKKIKSLYLEIYAHPMSDSPPSTPGRRNTF